MGKRQHPFRRGLLLAIGILVLASCSSDRGCELDDPADPREDPPVECPNGMDLQQSEVTLALGREVRVGVVGGHSSCPVTWTVDDTTIVRVREVNQDAMVTGTSPGTTTIRAHRGYAVGGSTDACTMTVTGNSFASLTISPDSMTVIAADSSSIQLLMLHMLDEAGEQVHPIDNVAWTISDSTLVSLLVLDVPKGTLALVHGLAVGEVSVVAAYDGAGTAGATLSDTCRVTVVPQE